MINRIPSQPATKAFMRFLSDNPAIRRQIRAAPDKTLLYSGAFFAAAFREIESRKLTDPQFGDKHILPDVLARIHVPSNLLPIPGMRLPNLLVYVQHLEQQVPKNPDQFMIWRALSGIFAANAVGKVSFWIGGGVDESKVFVATEMKVLFRNPNVDPLVKDLLEYYMRCAQNKNPAMNVGFISA
jgi:hypothetical protein